MDSGSRGPALLRRRLEPGQQVTPVASLGSALGPRPSSTSLAGSQVAERGLGHAPRWQTAAARPRGARRNVRTDVRTDVRPALRPAAGSRSPEHSRAAPGVGTVVSARARPRRGGGPGRGAGWPDSDRRGRRPPWLRALARPAALRRCHAPCDKPASRSGREARPSAGAVRPAGGNRRSPRSLPPASGAQDQPQAPVSHCETVRERSAQVCLPWDTWVCLPGRGERRRAEPPDGSARLQGFILAWGPRRKPHWGLPGASARGPRGDSPGQSPWSLPRAAGHHPRHSPRQWDLSTAFFLAFSAPTDEPLWGKLPLFKCCRSLSGLPASPRACHALRARGRVARRVRAPPSPERPRPLQSYLCLLEKTTPTRSFV